MPSNGTVWDQPQTNVQCLIRASIENVFYNSQLQVRYGTSFIGQEFGLVLRKRLRGGYQMHMVTANPRNSPFISRPFKVSIVLTLEEAELQFTRLCSLLLSPAIFHLGDQPYPFAIPVGKEMIQLDLVSESVHKNPEAVLQVGDELFVECVFGAVSFFHSGVYAGDSFVYHYMSDSQEVESALVSALSSFTRTPAAVLLDHFDDFVHALIEHKDTYPRVFRATHPFLCRTGEQVKQQAEELRKTWSWYDIRSRNCQHFSSFCARGVASSYDMQSNFKYLACTLIKPTAMLAIGSQQPKK